MWQLLLAAAAAASTGFLTKHILHHSDPQTPRPPPTSPDDSSNHRQNDSNFDHNGVFRFSSSSSAHKHNISKEKPSITGRKLKFGIPNDKDNHRSTSSPRRFAVSLKKRRTAKKLPATCRSPSSDNGNALFGWGLGVGIMYMISTGKAEINKLSNAMDETSKVVQELRTELYKRKSIQVAASSEDLCCNHTQQGSSGEDRHPKHVKISVAPLTDDAECPSSVLTEEPNPQVLEMDQLEAELASELQKLPWSDHETSGYQQVGPIKGKDEVSSGGILELEGKSTVPYQCHGVLPSELDQKLCHLLIEQQENQIEELESELQVAQSKLNEKEGELQALKDRVRRLTEFSLSTGSDDEPEGEKVEQDCIREGDNNSKIESDSELWKFVVGMKRHIDSAS